MSEITRTEKFLRACIDGEPCKLKPLTRIEKLLAELNETLAGGPSEVVILPETELEYTSDGYILPVPLENAPTGGGNYKIVWDGVEYISPALDVTETLGEGDLSLAFGDSTILMGEEGAAAVGNPLPGAPFFMMLFPNGRALDEGAPTIYGMFKATAEPTNPTLSIVEKAETASAGGGGFIVKATIGEIDPVVMSADCTFDKTFEETLAAIKAGQYVACHAMVEGMCIFRAISYEETTICFSITMGQTEMQIIMRASGGGSFILQGE